MTKRLLFAAAIAAACATPASADNDGIIHRDSISPEYVVDGIGYILCKSEYARNELIVTNIDTVVIATHGWEFGPDPYSYIYKIEDKFYTGNLTVPSEVFIEELGQTFPVTVVSPGAFVDNPDLESVTLPSSVKQIGQHAFAHNPNLKSVKITGNNVIELPAALFSGCTSLTSFDVPESVEIVDVSVFYDSGIESLSFSQNLDTFYEYTFDGADKLKSITINKATPVSVLYGLLHVPKGCVLYVPEEGVEVYRASKKWVNFAEILPIGSASIEAADAPPAADTAPAYNLLGQPVANPRQGDIILRNHKKLIIR